MSQEEKAFIKIWANLLKDTPNIRKYLEDQKIENPNNWKPWIFKIIKLFKRKNYKC